VTSTASILLLGFLLGIRHALEADHIAAVSAVVARHPTPARAAAVGALWGVGHAFTVFLLGGLIAWFRWVISPTVAMTLEFGVAIMLIGLGVSNVRHRAAAPAASTLRPVLVGMMHGLAGSAAIALLVLATVSNARVALGYLAVFGVGTIVAMTLATSAMALPLVAAGGTRQWERRLIVGSGLASVVVGLGLAVRLVDQSGLLRSGTTN
jgi:hypothetical protein